MDCDRLEGTASILASASAAWMHSSCSDSNSPWWIIVMCTAEVRRHEPGGHSAFLLPGSQNELPRIIAVENAVHPESSRGIPIPQVS